MTEKREYLEISGIDDIYVGRKYLVLVIYDVSDNKRRGRLVKFLEGYGVRVQKSAFECLIEESLYDKLCLYGPRLINMETDSLRIYRLKGTTDVKQWGRKYEYLDKEEFVII